MTPKVRIINLFTQYHSDKYMYVHIEHNGEGLKTVQRSKHMEREHGNVAMTTQTSSPSEIEILGQEETKLADNKNEKPGSAMSGWSKVKEAHIKFNKQTLIDDKERTEEDPYYKVWMPKEQPKLADLVTALRKKAEEQQDATSVPSTSKLSFRSRQQVVYDRAQATQAILKETTNNILKENSERETDSGQEKPPKITFKEASKLITDTIQKLQMQKKDHSDFSDIVHQYLAKVKAERSSLETASERTSSSGVGTTVEPLNIRKRTIQPKFNTEGGTLGAISIEKWRQFVQKKKSSETMV